MGRDHITWAANKRMKLTSGRMAESRPLAAYTRCWTDGRPDLGSDVVFLGFPLVVAAVAVWSRRWSAQAHWIVGCVLALIFSLGWFGFAKPGQPVSAPALVIVLPIAATFFVVSRRALARRSWTAWIMGVATCLGVAVVGLIVSVNAGLLRP